MKRLLLLAFLPLALAVTVSCSKDDEKTTPKSLVGTSWQCTHTFAVPIIGSASLTVDLSFVSEESCTASAATQPDLSSLLPIDLNGEFNYSFDGQQVHINVNIQQVNELVLDYVNGTMLVFTIPENYRQLLGTSELIFHKK